MDNGASTPATQMPGKPAAFAAGDAGASAQFITFTIGTEEYGVDIMAVREIKGWTETTSVPKAPEHVRGVINLRGIIVPIFDLRARFGQGTTQTTKSHVVIIVAIGTRVVGLLVDAVSDILTIERAEIRPIPDMERAAEDAFLEGLVALDQRMVTLVSLEGLFQAHRDETLPHDIHPSN
jgi:purine-binding chemotaxis protein CheW